MYVTEQCQELLTFRATSKTKKQKSIALYLNTRPLYRLPQTDTENNNVFPALDPKQTLERRFLGLFFEQVRKTRQITRALVDTVKLLLELKFAWQVNHMILS